MNKEEFRKQAQSAIYDGSAARAAIARAQAKEFLTKSGDFDPRALQKLGSSGLRHFLSSIDQTSLLAECCIKKPPEETIESSGQKGEPLGWDKQRRSEPMWTIRALIYGLSAGFVMLALFTIALKIINLGSY
jgi:hypothetical protein